MGILTEYNPDLALRSYTCFLNQEREKEECLPEKMEEGKICNFLKKGQRLYWLKGEIPLLETKGNENLSKPLASIVILESTHFIKDNEVWTKGKYKIIKKLDQNKIYFNGINKT